MAIITAILVLRKYMIIRYLELRVNSRYRASVDGIVDERKDLSGPGAGKSCGIKVMPLEVLNL